jgi:4-amino-4-deoxy-L-arabinose transferase-like glycosyltransferase
MPPTPAVVPATASPWLRGSLPIVLAAAVAALAVGYAPVPLWDEDEPRFGAIARTMVETGDWIVPTYNGTLAVDKPVLMHWCMAAAMTVFGPTEFACRLPSMLAALVTALALFRAGRRWFDETTGSVAALAYVGCLLVGIEAHAATPDAILVALCTWATVLAAEVITGPATTKRHGDRGTEPSGDTDAAPGAAARCIACGDDALARLGLGRAVGIGLLLGLAVVCKGPIGFVGPLAVIVPWAWWVAIDRRLAEDVSGPWSGRALRQAFPAVVDVIRSLRPLTLSLAMLAAAAPWYVAVSLRTDGEWLRGFLFVHNVGRFMAPMERHGGGVLFHPLTMLVGFYPWSCFLPLAVVVAAWRVCRRTVPDATAHVLGLLLVWLGVWVGGFSLAATKLPNYVLPAYPAAALLVAAGAVAAVRRATGPRPHWPHPRWLAAGVVSLAFGGAATAATILLATRYGLSGAEPAAFVGLVPITGAVACWLAARAQPRLALTAITATSLVFTALACGPAATWLARANRLPELVADLAAPPGARIATFGIGSPNVVFYAGSLVEQVREGRPTDATRFLAADAGGVLLVPEHRLDELRPTLPAGTTEVARTRPLFRRHDVVALTLPASSPADRSARATGLTR